MRITKLLKFITLRLAAEFKVTLCLYHSIAHYHYKEPIKIFSDIKPQRTGLKIGVL